VIETAEQRPIGAIFDTNSAGRFDLAVYDDGLLAVHGTYLGVALRAAGAGMVGAGGGGIGGAVAAGSGVAAGWTGGSRYEASRLARVLEAARDEVIGTEPNFFIPRESIIGLVLRRRWYGHSLTVRTHANNTGRKFEWKPKLNDFAQVQELLTAAFPGLVSRD
jgi:hypothetical protein